MKNNTSEQFDENIVEKTYTRIKLYKRLNGQSFMSVRIHTKNPSSKSIQRKEKSFFGEKLEANNTNPKELCENLK